PCPFQVILTDEFIESIDDDEARRRAGSSNSIAFGCEHLEGASVPPTGLQIADGRLPQAAQIYAFDHILGNIDRRITKPNCLDNGARFIVIDHEMCFSLMLEGVLLNISPWNE